jgi:hypothetical protein
MIQAFEGVLDFFILAEEVAASEKRAKLAMRKGVTHCRQCGHEFCGGAFTERGPFVDRDTCGCAEPQWGNVGCCVCEEYHDGPRDPTTGYKAFVKP